MTIETMISKDIDYIADAADRIEAIESNAIDQYDRSQKIMAIIEEHLIETCGVALSVKGIENILRLIYLEYTSPSCGGNIKHQSFWHRTRRLWDKSYYFKSLLPVMAKKAGLPYSTFNIAPDIAVMTEMHYAMLLRLAETGNNYYEVMKEGGEPPFLKYSRAQLFAMAPTLHKTEETLGIRDTLEQLRGEGAIHQEVGGIKPVRFNVVANSHQVPLLTCAIYRSLCETSVNVNSIDIDSLTHFVDFVIKRRLLHWEDGEINLPAELCLHKPELLDIARECGWMLPIEEIATSWFYHLVKHDLFSGKLLAVRLVTFMEEKYRVNTK